MNKKLLLLLGAYAAWVVAASVYSKKDKQLSLELCDKEKNCEDKTKLLLQNFVEIHQNMLDDLKKKYLTDENIKKFNEKKADLMVYLEDYKKEAEEIFLEVKEKWKDYLKEWLEKLEQIYNTQLNNIQEVDSKEKVEEYKQKLVEVYEDFKKKIKSL